MMPTAIILAGLLAQAAPAPVAEGPVSEAHVVIHTERGDIALTLDAARAPVSTCNFLRYVEAGRYDDARFFRTVVSRTNASPHPIDVIQAETTAGSDDPGFGPVALERTRDTGLRHLAGTISMARGGPDSATSSFFIVTRDTPALDFGGGRNPDGQGFAAFGRVTSGLDIVRAIQGLPAEAEQLKPPVRITSVERVGEAPPACRPQ
jgi:peptidyl-prolyl cis-trans isomerase A (cyclophilin A)